MSDTIFDRLAKHAAIFEKVAERNLASHHEEVQARGKEAYELAADLREAMRIIRTHDQQRGEHNG